MKRKQQPKEFRKNKKAFDDVIAFARKSQVATIGAVNPARGGGHSTPNPAKPTMVDFRADVMKVVQTKLNGEVPLWKFVQAYLLYDSEDVIDREIYAAAIIGDIRHKVEQRIGKAFIRRGIHPVNGKGYFYAPRRFREEN